MKSSLKADPALYQKTLSSSIFDLREARAEYSRLRKIAAKRLKRLGEKAPDSSIYQRYKDAFGFLDKDAKESTVRKALSEVAYFTELKTSSLSGLKQAKKKFVSSMQERGYDKINLNNVDKFGRFMQEAKDYYKSKKAFDSEKLYDDFFEFLEDEEADIDDVIDNFEDYIEELES